MPVAHPAGRKPDPSPRGKDWPGAVLVVLGGLFTITSPDVILQPPAMTSASLVQVEFVAVLVVGLALLVPGIFLVRMGRRQSKQLNESARIAYGMKEGTVQQLAVALDTQLHIGEDKLLKSYVPLLASYNNVITISGDRWTWKPGAEKHLRP